MKKSYIKYIAALLLFGMNGIVAGRIAMSSYEIVLTRTLIGSVLLAALFLITGNRFTFMKHKKDLMFICISGVAMGASWMFLYEAYAQIGVSLASLLYYCGPVIVMALSPLLFKEKLTVPKLLGFAAVLGGVVLVNGGFGSGGLSRTGLICAAMSAVTYAVMVTSNKMSKEIKGMENSVIQLVVSFITVAIFVLIKEGFTMTVPASSIPWILLLGTVNTGLGCFFYFSSIGSLPVQTVAVCGYIEPLSAVVFSVLLLHERLLPMQLLGAVLILGGAIAGECIKTKPRTAK